LIAKAIPATMIGVPSSSFPQISIYLPAQVHIIGNKTTKVSKLAIILAKNIPYLKVIYVDRTQKTMGICFNKHGDIK
jgi:hypothetical protein